jgi:hypothetical protein
MKDDGLNAAIGKGCRKKTIRIELTSPKMFQNQSKVEYNPGACCDFASDVSQATCLSIKKAFMNHYAF